MTVAKICCLHNVHFSVSLPVENVQVHAEEVVAANGNTCSHQCKSPMRPSYSLLSHSYKPINNETAVTSKPMTCTLTFCITTVRLHISCQLFFVIDSN